MTARRAPARVRAIEVSGELGGGTLGTLGGPPYPVRSVFATLSDRLSATFKNLRGKGRLSEADIDATVREIRRALLDADVAVPVVREFAGHGAGAGALGRGVQALNPAQQVVKIVHEELVAILGGADPPAGPGQEPADRHPARRSAGRRQDDPGRQAGAAPARAGSHPDAGRRRPAAPERGHSAAVVGERAGVPVFAPEPGSGDGERRGRSPLVERWRPGCGRPRRRRAGARPALRRRHRRHRRPARRRRRDDAAGRGHPRRGTAATRPCSWSTR